MKKTGRIILAFILLLGHGSCEKLPDPAGLRGVAVIPAITNVNPGIFNSRDLENSYIQFVITVPPGIQPEKITVVGSFKNNFERVTITQVTSFPATVRISSAEAAQKIGISLDEIANGDIFIFELLTEAAKKTTRSTAVLSVPVACSYDVKLAEGSYHSVAPDWGSEGNITLSADKDNPYIIYVTGLEEMEGLTEDLGPLVMNIDPATYNVVVPEKAISSEAWGYGSISYAGSGVYSSCDGTYTMYFDISLSSLGNVGKYSFTFTRNP